MTLKITRDWLALAASGVALAGALGLAGPAARAEEPPAAAADGPAPSAPPVAAGHDLLHIQIAIMRLSRLTVSRTANPVRWAAVEDGFGLLQLQLGAAENDAARLTEAIEAFTNALEVRTRERYPEAWGATQGHLADALRFLGANRKDLQRLEQAAVAYHAAMESQRRDRVPLAWASLQARLGVTLWAIGDTADSAGRLDDAAIAFRMALGEYDRRRTPAEWLITQRRLVLVLLDSDSLVEDPGKLTVAAMAAQAVVDQHDRRGQPQAWAEGQFDLARILLRLGEREAGIRHFEDAVDTFRAALEVFPEDSDAWRNARFELGYALQALGERQVGSTATSEALQIFETLLEQDERNGRSADWPTMQNNLCVVLRNLGQAQHDPARLADAVRRCHLALDALEPSRAAERANVQDRLGDAMAALAVQTGDSAQLRAAIAVFDESLAAEARQADPRGAAASRGRQAVAMMRLADATQDAELAARAVAQLAAAGATLHDLQRPFLADIMGRHLAEARTLRDRLAAR